MRILSQIKDSMYGPKYYRELLNQPFSYSVKYIFKLTFIFALLVIVKFSVLSLPEIVSMINSIGPGLINNYPQELEIIVKKGNISTNAAEPYLIKTPDSWNDGKSKEKIPENLIAIDTKGEPNPDNLKKYDTLILITERYLVYKDSNE